MKKKQEKGITGTIKIATKPMTEQYILGEMLKQLIENKTDYKVEVTKGIEEERVIFIRQWKKVSLICIRIYFKWLGNGTGNQAGEVSDDEILEKLQKEYQEKVSNDMAWTLRI